MRVSEDNNMRIFNTDPHKKINPSIFDDPKNVNELHKVRDKINELYIKFQDDEFGSSSAYENAILECLEIIDKHIDQIKNRKL